MSEFKLNVEKKPMPEVYLSIGSNIDRENNIAAGLKALRTLLGTLKCSQIYESEAVGFNGENFYNLVVSAFTDLSIRDLAKELHAIEDKCLRKRNGPKFASRTLDIDILLYDDFIGESDGIVLPREEITQHAFVLLPLSELAPNLNHPRLNATYAQLWDEFDKERQKLWPIGSKIT